MAIKIRCPNCASQICKTLIETHFLNDLIYTKCDFCGNKVSEDDIISQIQEHIFEKFSKVINKKS